MQYKHQYKEGHTLAGTPQTALTIESVGGGPMYYFQFKEMQPLSRRYVQNFATNWAI